MELNNNIEVAERDGVSRRVIVKSAAWSVPVFAAVGVTPAFAASGLTSSSLVVTKAGNDFIATWTFAPPTLSGLTIRFVGLTVTGTPVSTGNEVTFTAPLGKENAIPNFTATVTAGGLTSTFSVVGTKLTGQGATLDVTQRS